MIGEWELGERHQAHGGQRPGGLEGPVGSVFYARTKDLWVNLGWIGVFHLTPLHPLFVLSLVRPAKSPLGPKGPSDAAEGCSPLQELERSPL